MPEFGTLFPVDMRIDAEIVTTQTPYDKLMWEQTGKRHYPSYFKRLKDSHVSFAFGGYFSSAFPRSVTNPLLGKINGLITKLGVRTETVIQYDSWRFWESLLAGCVTLHIDLAKYGAVMPVMPENWKHYVGIDLDDINGSIDAIKTNMHRFSEISKAGREWALKNYHPKLVAQRFLWIVQKFIVP